MHKPRSKTQPDPMLALALSDRRKERTEPNEQDIRAARAIINSGVQIESMCVVCHTAIPRKRKTTALACYPNCHYYWHHTMKLTGEPGYKYTQIRAVQAERRAMLAICARLAPVAAAAPVGAKARPHRTETATREEDQHHAV